MHSMKMAYLIEQVGQWRTRINVLNQAKDFIEEIYQKKIHRVFLKQTVKM